MTRAPSGARPPRAIACWCGAGQADARVVGGGGVGAARPQRIRSIPEPCSTPLSPGGPVSRIADAAEQPYRRGPLPDIVGGTPRSTESGSRTAARSPSETADRPRPVRDDHRRSRRARSELPTVGVSVARRAEITGMSWRTHCGMGASLQNGTVLSPLLGLRVPSDDRVPLLPAHSRGSARSPGRPNSGCTSAMVVEATPYSPEMVVKGDTVNVKLCAVDRVDRLMAPPRRAREPLRTGSTVVATAQAPLMHFDFQVTRTRRSRRRSPWAPRSRSRSRGRTYECSMGGCSLPL